jgi:LuxR family maltose regulon positive regulatory protein
MACVVSRNVMKPRIECVLTPWNPCFTASGSGPDPLAEVRSAAGTAPAAAGGRADRGPRGRSAVQPGRGGAPEAAPYDPAPAAQYDLAPAAQYDLAPAAQYDLAPAAQYDLAPAARAGLSDELRALALIILGDTEIWGARLDQAEPHLEQAAALARRIGRPYLEFSALAHQSAGEVTRSLPRAAELSGRAIDLAERHGWTDETAAGIAYMALGSVLAWQGRLGEAEAWLQRAERTVRAEADPAVALAVRHIRAQLELARGREADALAAFRAAERLAGHLAAPNALAAPMRALLLLALVRLGETGRAEQVLAGLGDRDRDLGEMRVATAVLRLAQDDPDAATVALAPVLDESAPVGWRSWLVEAFLLEAIARDALGDPAAAGRALEQALDLAEPDGALLWFLLHPVPGLLERQARQGTAHAALIARILDLLAGNTPAPPARPRPLLEPLSGSEIRVLRYLPTHLSAPEIAGELSVSTSTVKTHMRNLYAKLGVHSRAEAVASARALSLLAPSARSR